MFNFVFVSNQNCAFITWMSKPWKSGSLEFSNCSCKFATECTLSPHVHHRKCGQPRHLNAFLHKVHSILLNSPISQCMGLESIPWQERRFAALLFMKRKIMFSGWSAVFHQLKCFQKNNTTQVDKLDKCVLMGNIWGNQEDLTQKRRKVPVLDTFNTKVIPLFHWFWFT